MPQNCPIPGLVDDLGRFFADHPDDGPDRTAAGVAALRQGLADLDAFLATAFAPHEVVAAELRLDGPGGHRRTVFPTTPAPVALVLLCTRLCCPGDHVTILQHTAAQGTAETAAPWPFGIETAERLTRPPLSGPPAESLPGRSGPTIP